MKNAKLKLKIQNLVKDEQTVGGSRLKTIFQFPISNFQFPITSSEQQAVRDWTRKRKKGIYLVPELVKLLFWRRV